jgi:hypothetical protein
MDNEWKADPKKYAEIAQPFESEEQATKVAAEFFNAVRKLREQYRIPEVIVSYQVYVKTDKGVEALMGSGGWGDQSQQAKLAKRCFDVEIESFFMMFDNLLAKRPRTSLSFLTDPKFDEPRGD